MPKTVPPYILELKKQYEEASLRLWKKVANTIPFGSVSTYNKGLANQADAEIAILDEFVARWTKALVTGDVISASRTMYTEMRKKLGMPLIKSNSRNIQIIIDNLTDNLLTANHFAGRKIKDDIRTATLESLQQKTMQGMTLPGTKRLILKKFAEKGILHIEDKNGRSIPLTSYAEMVARSTHAEVVNTGVVEDATDAGEDLVIMTSHMSTCKICAMYEGRVYSISGKTPGYPRLERAFGAGYANIHPNCIHVLTNYYPDLDPDAEKQKQFSSRPFAEDAHTKKATAGYREAQMKKTRMNNDKKAWMNTVATVGRKKAGNLSDFRTLKEKARIPVIAKPVVKQFTPASTIEEAAKYAKKEFGLKTASFKGIDLDVVNSNNEGMFIMFNRYPQLRETITEATARPLKSVYGQFVPSPKGDGTGWLEYSIVNMGKSEKFDKIMAMGRERLFDPANVTDRKQIAIHELTHAIEYYMNANKFKGMEDRLRSGSWNRGAISGEIKMKALDMLNLKTGPLEYEATKELGAYAMKSSSEFIAQAMSDAMLSPKPLQVSKNVLKIIDEMMGVK